MKNKNLLPKQEVVFKNIIVLSTYLIIVWGFYRMLFKLPEEVEETIIKPIVWLIPVIFLVKKEKANLKSLGITFKNLFPSIYLALGLGILFALEGLIVNFIKYRGMDFSVNLGENGFFASLFISFATAISEEITFRGYLFTRFQHFFKNELAANLVTTFLWSLIHVPISIFWWELDLSGTLGFLALTMVFGFGASYLFARTKNIISPILLHVLWSWPILLFR